MVKHDRKIFLESQNILQTTAHVALFIFCMHIIYAKILHALQNSILLTFCTFI